MKCKMSLSSFMYSLITQHILSFQLELSTKVGFKNECVVCPNLLHSPTIYQKNDIIRYDIYF